MKKSINPSTPPGTLPIIAHLGAAYKYWHICFSSMPKSARYSLGVKIDSMFVQTLEFLFLAGSAPRAQKVRHLQQAVALFDLLKFFLRIAWESKALDNKKYLHLSGKLDEIGRMLGGWYKKAQKETSAS